MAETVWYKQDLQKQQETDLNGKVVKVFLRYVIDIVRTVRGDPGLVLETVTKLHPK